MAILAECPLCHHKQAVKNRKCGGDLPDRKSGCGADLVKLKKSGKVRYWIQYRLPGGKKQKESVGFSIEEARDAEGKRRGQKRENRIFDMLPESKMTFSELAQWYLELPTVKKLASLARVGQVLTNFNVVFGNRVVGSLRPLELEEYQDRREREGYAPATIDMEISTAKTMVTKAFDNDMVDGKVLKAFRKVRRKLKKGGNVRKRIITTGEFLKLRQGALPHLKLILTIAFHTGMRAGELRLMQWSFIDREKGFIRLPDGITKERKAKIIPINHHVRQALAELPRALHHDFVFTFKGRPIRSRDGLKRSFISACKAAGLPSGRADAAGITFHDIRRTVKTNMLRAGVDKVYRDTILGHRLEGMDVHYLVPTEEDLHRAMDIYTTWLDGEIEFAVSKADKNGEDKAESDFEREI